MAIDDPRSKGVSFSQAAGVASLPDTANAALLFGASATNPAVPRIYGSGATIRSAFGGETMLAEIADNHFATDPARHPVLVLAADVATDGVLHLDDSLVTGGGTIAADGTTKPLGDWPDLYVEFITGGTAGVPGIEVYLSLDGGLKKVRTSLLSAKSIEFAGKGIKINLTGDFDAGSIITGWTEPPRWDETSFAAAKTALLSDTNKFSLICIAEPVTPDDWTLLTGLLNALESAVPRRFAHIVGAKRRRYHPATEATITATFVAISGEDPATLTRASGSWITDGFKVGMRISITGAVNSANNDTFVRVDDLNATVLTMSPNVDFTAEAASPTVVVNGEETQDDYQYNVNAEWATYHDTRITLTNTPIRAQRPIDGFTPDQNLHGFLWSRAIATPIQTEPAKRRRDAATGGGVVAPELAGRITEGTSLVLPDVSMPAYASLVLPPSRAVALEREGDGTGPYFTQARTMYQVGGTDEVDRLVFARIINEAKYTALTVLTPEIFDDEETAPGQPDKLSSKVKSRIESAVRTALQKKLGNAISNAFAEDPAGALFEILNETDLSTGVVQTAMFFRSRQYNSGFAVRLSVAAPGK